MGGLGQRDSRAGVGVARTECPEVLLSIVGICSQHRGPSVQASWA